MSGFHLRPAPSFRPLYRYDLAVLIWLLRGWSVIALTTDEVAIQVANAVTVYRKHSRPELKPIGDSLDDFGCCS